MIIARIGYMKFMRFVIFVRFVRFVKDMELARDTNFTYTNNRTKPKSFIRYKKNIIS